MAEIGYTFEPGRNQKRMLSGINQGRLGPVANEALRVLSLRLPQVLGGSPIAPSDLLRPRVGGVAPGSAVTQSLQASGAVPAGGPPPLNTAGPQRSSFGVARFGGSGIPNELGKLIETALTPIAPPSITPGTPQEGQERYDPPTVSAGPQDRRRLGGFSGALLRMT